MENYLCLDGNLVNNRTGAGDHICHLLKSNNSLRWDS